MPLGKGVIMTTKISKLYAIIYVMNRTEIFMRYRATQILRYLSKISEYAI